MEWVLRSPQIHSIFSNLGYLNADGYHVNENCNAALEAILINILTEDKYLRTYRRSISFGENIKKDLIPLLIHAKEDKTIELLTRILVNLTIPIECLLSVDIISKNDFGRHTIFEINNLLASTKIAFTDQRATRVVIEFMKKNADTEQKNKLLPEQCSNVQNSLLLLRNILHIPEERLAQSAPHAGTPHTVQNQILWNIFSQSIDKILIKLMSIPDACNWGVTMVQFIALLYKDQHVVTLHKLLNMWLETSLSESSEDNESNTPPDRGSDDSSPMLTSDPTSDSSDTGAKSHDEPTSINNKWQAGANKAAVTSDPTSDLSDTGGKNHEQPTFVKNEWQAAADSAAAHQREQKQTFHNDKEENVVKKTTQNNEGNVADNSMKCDNDTAVSCTSGIQSEKNGLTKNINVEKTGISETSDCGYGTQIENQESISTSSNEDDLPSKKPVHQKPHNPKQKPNTKVRTGTTLQERKRKKIVKRGKSNIINVHGLTHKTPTDDDISNVLKEFTVDFLLKGYKSLVSTLHHEILTNQQLEIDTSHFFWLVTYFLKFATQIELDLEHVNSVLSFDIVAYLTAEGVNLCEQFELVLKLDGQTITPTIRRLHLVVTAIREFVQALEEYKKISSINKEDHESLIKLQISMCETEELRALLVLLIRSYNPKYQSKQYLQDLIVTNHILLMFLDNVMKLPEYNGSASMVHHLRQFATPEIMNQYGVLLEDYSSNGEFVNDCIFTVMHHVAGDLDSLNTLYQPRILKTFTSIWKSEFDICDDWTDLVEYVLNTFTKKPDDVPSGASFPFAADTCDVDLLKLIGMAPLHTQELNGMEAKMKLVQKASKTTSKERWTEDELSSLNWMYLQCSAAADAIGEVMKLLKEDGIIKSKESVIRELYKQKIINKDEYKKYMRGDSERRARHANKEMREDDISKLCMQLAEDSKAKFLDWVQKVLLETCYAKIYLEKKKMDESQTDDSTMLNFEVFKKKAEDMPVLSPVSYHSLNLNQSVPLVPWNCQQADICKDLKFLQLLHKLGFHMPVDSGKVFIRIPHFWTADFLYDVARKISPIDTSKLKFSVNEFAETSATIPPPNEDTAYRDMPHSTTMLDTDNFYQVHKQTHFATMVNFTPTPGCTYNSEASEIDLDWLNVVQKSQEFKLTLNPDSPEAGGSGEQGAAPPPGLPYLGTLLPGAAPLHMPTIMTVKQEISTYSVTHVDEYYSHSVCETASVASDLTRMYVSDEDEKPDEGPDTARPSGRGPPSDMDCQLRDIHCLLRDPDCQLLDTECDMRDTECELRDTRCPPRAAECAAQCDGAQPCKRPRMAPF